MRYPPKAYKKDFESVDLSLSLIFCCLSSQDRREREQQDLELAEDDEDEDFP